MVRDRSVGLVERVLEERRRRLVELERQGDRLRVEWLALARAVEVAEWFSEEDAEVLAGLAARWGEKVVVVREHAETVRRLIREAGGVV